MISTPSDMTTKILWIESNHNMTPSFVPSLQKKGYLVETVSSGKEAITRISFFDPELAVVNAASLRSNGQRICRALLERLNGNPILLIRDQAHPFIEETVANRVLVLPFTIRKLLNRIQSLVPESKGKVLTRGPITLDPKSNILLLKNHCPRHLTPKLAMLLCVFMQHPGQVMDREGLFREIWQTDYVGDTRTLDTHISWLRGLIEANPQKPQLLKTVRGVGYRLDV